MQPDRSYPLRLALAIVLVLTAAAPAQKVFRDEKYGYSVKTVAKWVPVPVQPTDRFTAAKWSSPRAERLYMGEMYVHVFNRKQEKPTPVKTDGPEERIFQPNARSFEDWAKFNRYGLKLENPKPITFKVEKGGTLSGKLYEAHYGEMEIPGVTQPTGYFCIIAVFPTTEREYAVELSCGTVNERKYRRKFLSVARSFRVLSASAQNPSADIKKASNQLSPRELARQRARRDADRVKGWWYVESENYFIVTNTPKKKKQSRIIDLQRRLEAMRKVYEHDFPPGKPIEAISIVRVCKDQQSYSQYGGPGGTGGYWNYVAKELVLFHRGEKSFARSVLNHEAFHQYIHYAVGGADLHIWFNEGHADYYGGAEILGSRVSIKPNKMRVDTIRSHVRAGTHVPLKKLLRMSQMEYYSNASLCYAEGWSLVYFFYKGLAPDHPWRNILPTYYRTLLDTGKQEEARKAAFKGVDLEALEGAWKDYTVHKRVAKP